MRITPFRKLVKPDEALRTVLEHSAPTNEVEEVPLAECGGRVLAGEVRTGMDVPPFDRSAMDGYAVRSADVEGARELSPVTLKVVGELFAGDARRIAVSKGTACRVATGARMPEGADAVIMAEYTNEEKDEGRGEGRIARGDGGRYAGGGAGGEAGGGGGSVAGCGGGRGGMRGRAGMGKAVVRVLRAEPKFGNVSKKGSDMRKGAVVLARGTVLDPAKAGVLASVGSPRAKVLAKPRLAIVPTGDEIAEPGGKLGPAQVFNSNSFTLSALVAASGGAPELLPRVEDTTAGLKKAFAEVRKQGFAAIVLSGGSSVGERDLLFGVVSELGEVLFHGVQIKPGKPFLFGKVGGLLAFGVPGYPASCLTVGYVFLAPAVRRMAGLPETRRTVKARAARRIASRLGRVQFLPVKVVDGEAHPVFKESGAITSLAAADGYIIIRDNVEFIEKGEDVEVVLF